MPSFLTASPDRGTENGAVKRVERVERTAAPLAAPNCHRTLRTLRSTLGRFCWILLIQKSGSVMFTLFTLFTLFGFWFSPCPMYFSLQKKCGGEGITTASCKHACGQTFSELSETLQLVVPIRHNVTIRSNTLQPPGPWFSPGTGTVARVRVIRIKNTSISRPGRVVAPLHPPTLKNCIWNPLPERHKGS